MIADLGTTTSKLFERWGWKCIPPLVLCWVALWPVGLAWLALSLAGAYRDRDRSSQARVERRVARFAALYLPSALQWPTIAVMFIAGSAMLGMAIRGMPALRQSG